MTKLRATDSMRTAFTADDRHAVPFTPNISLASEKLDYLNENNLTPSSVPAKKKKYCVNKRKKKKKIRTIALLWQGGVRLQSHQIVRFFGRAICVDLKYIQPIVNVGGDTEF